MLRSASASSALYSDNGTIVFSTANNTARDSEGGTGRPFPTVSAKALALRALKALSKSAVASLQIDEVPTELLFGEKIDLHRWTMVLTDKNLQELSEQQNSGKRYYLDASSGRLLDMFHSFYSPMYVKEGLLSLNIANAKGITDFGLTIIARSSPHLQQLNISGCSTITDIALREVGMCCNKLQALNISSCFEIDGTGLTAVAESCRQLLKLDISKCHKIANWSVQKVFYYCKVLEEVNISHMSKISDEEIRTLAQNCPHLIALHAAECPYISDTSIQTVAQCCRDLDLLDVSRSEMQYRISDVSLLALGQSSRSLRTLRLSGCDVVTDVGLNWLTEGCKVIEELDLSRCTKITDAGLRVIGTQCHALVTIDISYAKSVTDVGISSLSLGCPVLRHVKFHGVFMLSDPRLSAPKKGAKLEAWQAVIGVAALAEHCHYLETLDLSGCFRLNIALHQYVASFHHLTVLNLAGCNQSNPEALTAVAKGCPLLAELNLSDCGKSLNNKCIQAFAVHCKLLRVLTLCRCTQVSGGAMKAISSMVKLEKLDLTGCKTLTDSMLLYLTEVDKVPLLRTLSLVDVPAITDSLLTWLSIKSHNILCLALKGTAITIKGIKSVRDRFPNSEMLQNANFYGFWPKMRVDDRILINKYHNFIDGITRIQSRVRKHRAVLRVERIQLEWRRIAAQLMLQKVMRGYAARARTRTMRAHERFRQRSAVIVTSIFRIAVALKKCARRRKYLLNRLKNDLAVKIQLCWRKHRDLGILKARRIAYIKLLGRRQLGALKMQTAAYIFFARKRVARIKALKRTRQEVAHRKATLIQRCYRGAVARRITERYRNLFKSMASRRLAAAIRIQRKVRCIRTNNIVNAAIYVRLHRLESVIRIQSVMRGALARIHVAELRTERNELNRIKAAIKLQTRLRMLKASMELQKRLRARDDLRRRQYAAAVKIVGQARIKIACVRYREKRREYRRKMKEIVQRELDAACKIQARVRGIKGRKLFEAKMRVRKGKWKELFDEKAQKRFFYNKLSGEIRWRMPQDLLDLIPHPHCDNCHHHDATLECSVCNELFCGPCFDSVHAGGRRKEHPFRALYDYYNKRLDYGDGEFPCKWPTEVMQDEVQGWMLRVAPQRNPVRKYTSGWEEYEEGVIVPSKKIGVSTPLGNGGKLFYFNRNTFEATYELPAEVNQELEEEAQAAALAQEQQVTTFAQSSGYYDSTGEWVNTDYYEPLPWAEGSAEAGSMVPYDTNGFNNPYAVDPYSETYAPSGETYYPAATGNSEYEYNYANSEQQAIEFPAQRPVLSGTGQSYRYTNPNLAEENSSQYEQYGPYDAAAEGAYDQYNQAPPYDGYETPQKQLEYDAAYYDYEAPPTHHTEPIEGNGDEQWQEDNFISPNSSIASDDEV